MKLEEKLFLENRAWSKDKTAGDADYFMRLAKGQSPQVLWIGCSDSRVPTEEITNSAPGEIFVHRNIANQVHARDPNVSSIIEYGVLVLKVTHIVVCGHYECGGMRAAMDIADMEGNLGTWLATIRANCENDLAELRRLEDQPLAANKLAERNVVHQVQSLLGFDCIKKAKQERGLSIHGWIFDLKSGLLKDLIKA